MRCRSIAPVPRTPSPAATTPSTSRSAGRRDGDRLAVRAVQGATPFDAGASHVELVGRDGARERVSDSADVLIVGWLR